MERFQEYRQKARERLNVADHMLTMTYPLVKDNKLLLVAAESLLMALTDSLTSLLHYERLFKRIPPFHDTLDSKLNIFLQSVQPRYRIDKNYLKLITELNELVKLHKESPIEFNRKDKYIIATQKFSIREITAPQIKEYITQSKRFIEAIEQLVSKDEYIFR